MAKRRPQGDGMVRKRSDGRWEARIVIGHKNDGTPMHKSVFGKTQKETLDKLHRAIETYRDVDLCEDSRMTLGEWLDKWLDEYMIFTLRESTMQSYRMMVNHYIKPHLGKKPLTSLTTADIQKLYNKLKKEGRVREDPIKGKTLADSMVRGIHMMLHEALDAAVKERLIVRNPTNGTTVPKPNYPDKQVLDDGQLEKFLGMIEAYPDWRDFFYTECMTGLRRGEICGLKWSDIDFENRRLRVERSLSSVTNGKIQIGETKTGAGKRTIVLPPTLAALLAKRKENALNEWVFYNPCNPNLPMNPAAAYQKLHTILKNAELPRIRFHDLRHPYVKHTTKIFSLRLMDFQAQAYPDARRKTRGACQLLRGGQSRSPVRPLCNRKRFSCLPPQSKMSWILYAISMRLSGYTSTRSISSSASSVVSVSASKIALDASLRLSCRVCSSCFCFACANTAA